MYLNDIYTVTANLAGIPGLNVPCGLSSNRLPIGFQLLGAYWSEPTLLKLAHAYETARPFTERPPFGLNIFATSDCEFNTKRACVAGGQQ